MFPAVWEWDRDFYQEDFARYVDAVVADEMASRATATAAADGTPSPPRTLSHYADLTSAAIPAC